MINCLICHKKLVFLQHSKKDKKFCSRLCIDIFKKLQRNNLYYINPKKCLYCDKVIQYENKINKFCNHSCATSYNNKNRSYTEETKTKQRNAALQNPSGWAKDFSLRGHKKGSQYSKNNIEQICLECKMIFISKNYKKRKYCSRECASKNRYYEKSNIKHRSVYNGYQMDSGAERIFAQTLDKYNIVWIKNDKNVNKYFECEIDGKKRRYYPDFFLPDYNMWVEIKGQRYIREGDDIRRSAIPTKTVLLISNNFKKNLLPFIESLIGDP